MFRMCCRTRKKDVPQAQVSEFKNKAHLLQGDSCIVCGFTDSNVLFGGCDSHHIIPMSQGGTHDAENNAAILCSHCHTLTHRGIISTDKLLSYVEEAKKRRIKSKITPSFIDKVRRKVSR